MVLRRVYALHRASEAAVFNSDITHRRLLFHGSRRANWLGILSRGLLLPRSVLRRTGARTDAGMLGAGATTRIVGRSKPRRLFVINVLLVAQVFILAIALVQQPNIQRRPSTYGRLFIIWIAFLSAKMNASSLQEPFYVAVALVALGDSKNFTEPSPHLTAPPPPYHSCCSVKSSASQVTVWFFFVL